MKLTPLDPWIQTKIGAGSLRLLRSELESYQLERLRQTIHLAREKSRFYARRLIDTPHEISCLRDLEKFPFTNAEDIRNEGEKFLCVSQSDIHRIVTLDTSGTTGLSKRIYFTQADQELTIDFFAHGMSTFTKAGDRVMILLPYERPSSVGDLLATGLLRLGATPVCYGPVHNPEEALKVMDTQRINILVGVPVNILTLARFWDVRKKELSNKPEKVLLSTDYLPRAIANALENIWECVVYNHYGMTEMGLGGGVECQARRGFHLREADLYFEIIDPRSGKTLPAGEYGEIVFTTLTRQGMPLIRYRTGDLSRFIYSRCPCGTALRTLENVSRRNNGQITINPVYRAEIANPKQKSTLCMAELDEALFPLPDLVNFSAMVEKKESTSPEGKIILSIHLVVMPGAGEEMIHQARMALKSIPAIQNALLSGSFDISLTVQDYDINKAGDLRKRMLVDQRGEHHAGSLV